MAASDSRRRASTGRLLGRGDWLFIGLVGAIVFLLGIYLPATNSIRGPTLYGTSVVALLLAVIGGVVASYGIGKWYDLRPGGAETKRAPPVPGRADRIEDAPSFEVYRPDGSTPPRRGP